jgi:hypothetical protein
VTKAVLFLLRPSNDISGAAWVASRAVVGKEGEERGIENARQLATP